MGKHSLIHRMLHAGAISLLALCFILSTGNAHAAESDTVSRGQWISQLVATFEMTIEDEATMPDNYFSDLTSEDERYTDILTAVEFGVVDLEAGEAIQPDAPTTREFAAQTLNYCLGFQLEADSSYTYSDSDSTEYPDDVQVAVNRGWFQLVNGAFCPAQPITESEMQAMLADAKAVLSKETITETESQFDVAEGVIIIPDTASISIDMDDNITITGYDGTIRTGDVFVATFGGIPVAYQAESVSETDGSYFIAGVTNDATDAAITSVDSSGVSAFSLDNFEPAEEASYYITNLSPEAYGEVSVMTITPRGVSFRNNTLTVTETIKLNNATSGSITAVISNINIEHDIDGGLFGLDKAYVALNGNLSTTVSVNFNMSEYAGIPSTLTLGGVNLGAAKLSLDVKFELSGGITASWIGYMKIGVSYTDGDGVRLLTGFQKKTCDFSVETNLRAGLQATASLNVVVVKGQAWIGTGIKGSLSANYYDSGSPSSCKTILGYLYAEAGYSVSIGSMSYGDVLQIYSQRNSPVRVLCHYEDNKLVSTCSRDPAGYRYYTSLLSPYFNPGPSYASSSYSMGGVVLPTYTYEVLTDEETQEEYASITGYTGNPAVLAIPSTLDGYTVRTIADRAFEGKTSLRAVTIPDSVTSIGNFAFSGCTSLSNVQLPVNLVSIGRSAFQNCISLVEIEIPKSLEQVSGNTAYAAPFSGSGLTTVTFEAGTTKVVGDLFADAANLTNVTLLDTITVIENYAFDSCTALSYIDFPDSVTSIGNFAFSNCTSLSNIQLPVNLVSIGRSAFQNCISLVEIEIPKSLEQVSGNTVYAAPFSGSGLTTVTFEEGRVQVPEHLFMDAAKLENVTLLDTMETIGARSFEGCSSLVNITIPDSVTSIDDSAFKDCISLSGITIPNSVTEIGSSAFSGCSLLEEVKLPVKLTIIRDATFQNCAVLSTIELPETLEEIQGNAFSGSGLTQITIPGGCKTIGNDAFNGCIALTEVVLQPGVQSVDSSCFNGCTALIKVELPSTLTSLGNNAFRSCEALPEIVLPNSVTSIGTYAFAYCNTLSQVTLGSGLTEIPGYAFYECPALNSVSIPYRVATISEYAFANCTNLTEIMIPQSITNIATTAFSYPQKMTIYGVSGSYAETFANDHNIKFEVRDNPATSVSLDKTELTLNRGSSTQLILTVLPENFTDTVSWKSGNPSVATVTDDGVVKGIAVGTTTIKVVVGNASASCTVTVSQPVTSISLNETSLELEATESFQLKATVRPTDAQNREVTWSSSDSTIVSVDETGLITAHKKGTATITATAKDGSMVSKDCVVTVPNNAYVMSSTSEFESSHPYVNNCSDIWIYTVTDATYLELLFDISTEMEDGFDYLYIYDSTGNEVGKYTGTSLAGQTIHIEGNTVKIKLDSDESGTEWGFKVNEVRTDGTVNVYEGLVSEINRLSMLTDVSEMIAGAQEIGQSELLEAMQDLEHGVEVVEAISELEQSTKIETKIEVSADMAVHFKEDDIQALGAALNIAQLSTDTDNAVTLLIDMPSTEHDLGDQYGNALGFSMQLTNVSENLSVPVRITLPVPSAVDTEGLVLFHYKEDGTSETVAYTLSQENGQAYVTFILTDFSDFQFANLNYMLGDANADGVINITDVNLLFMYVNRQIDLTETQLACADVNDDGIVNITDVNRLFLYVNKQITEL